MTEPTLDLTGLILIALGFAIVFGIPALCLLMFDRTRNRWLAGDK